MCPFVGFLFLIVFVAEVSPYQRLCAVNVQRGPLHLSCNADGVSPTLPCDGDDETRAFGAIPGVTPGVTPTSTYASNAYDKKALWTQALAKIELLKQYEKVVPRPGRNRGLLPEDDSGTRDAPPYHDTYLSDQWEAKLEVRTLTRTRSENIE